MSGNRDYASITNVTKAASEDCKSNNKLAKATLDAPSDAQH